MWFYFLLQQLFFFTKDKDAETKDEILSFEECVKAGNPILESYPEQCKTSDGKTFVNTNQIDNSDDSSFDGSEQDEFYGSSTNSDCTVDSDCKALGCNMEICGGVSEDIASVCLFPESPLPQDLGYTCGCVDGGCHWSK